MPRGRSHWSLLGSLRDSLATACPTAHTLIRSHPATFFAGGILPDSLRLFAGMNKDSSHFYDDQRPATWDRAIATLCARNPAVANPGQLDDADIVWMLGVIAHITADLAYWEHIIPLLPPGPPFDARHYGAWLLMDRLPVPAGDRLLRWSDVAISALPPFGKAGALRQLWDQMVERVLPPDDPWVVESGYRSSGYSPRLRHNEANHPISLDTLVQLHSGEWADNVALVHDLLVPGRRDSFVAGAVARGTDQVERYLRGEFVPNL
ncbi:MAG: hypothetical protein CL878_06460 [Dehalococcoidia bacterium]|nr:hypothetical protein [Dehalococcoidia bacterium]